MQGYLRSKEEVRGRRWSLFRDIVPPCAVDGEPFLIQTYPDIKPIFEKEPYVPTVFGFKVEDSRKDE